MSPLRWYTIMAVSAIAVGPGYGGGSVTPPARELLVGGDVSAVARIEELGGIYRDGGEPADALTVFRRHGWTCLRLRLFVNPTKHNAVVNDLPYTLALARRIKATGFVLLLDIHYSDTWADPGHQTKPAAWEPLAFPALVARMDEYTASVMRSFREADALPDLVQIGNEITPGMLWPDGRLSGDGPTRPRWQRFTTLLKAGIRGLRREAPDSQQTRVVIHIDGGGKRRRTKWFFDNLQEWGVDYQVIGLSYYPWWHGSMAALRDNLNATAADYGKDVLVVETAYPYRNAAHWSQQENMEFSISPAGQAAFLKTLVETVQAVPAGRGIGALYWYPEAIPVNGLKVWNGGATGLFDNDGNALPGLDALGLPRAR